MSFPPVNDSARPGGRIICSRNLRAQEGIVGEVVAPHRLTAQGGDDAAWRLVHTCLGTTPVVELWEERPCTVRVPRMKDFWLLVVPMHGAIDSRLGQGPMHHYAGDCWQMVDPDSPLHSHIGADMTQVMLRLDPQVCLARLCDGAGRPALVPGPLRVDAEVAAATRELLAAVLAGVRSIDHEPLAGGVLDAAREPGLWRLLAAAINCTGGPDDPAQQGEDSRAAEALVARAIDYVHATLTEEVGLDDIAAAVGVSRRTLVRHFRGRRGISPMTLRRRLRLQRAHEELLASDPARVRVVDVAYRWGFFNLGHFAGLYRRVFGCTPSQSLRVCGTGA